MKPGDHDSTLDAVSAVIERHGVQVLIDDLPPGQVAAFDSRSITFSRALDPLEAAFYLAHSFGSIVGWSRAPEATKAMLEQLRAAKETTAQDRMDAAIDAFRRFEEASTAYGADVLRQAGFDAIVETYSEFCRADLEAMTSYHRTGALPEWQPYLAEWMAAVQTGHRPRRPFTPQAIPPFTPRVLERQTVVRRDAPSPA